MLQMNCEYFRNKFPDTFARELLILIPARGRGFLLHNHLAAVHDVETTSSLVYTYTTQGVDALLLQG